MPPSERMPCPERRQHAGSRRLPFGPAARWRTGPVSAVWQRRRPRCISCGRRVLGVHGLLPRQASVTAAGIPKTTPPLAMRTTSLALLAPSRLCCHSPLAPPGRTSALSPAA